MQREIIMAEIAMEHTNSEYLCDLYNDYDNARRECGPEDELLTIEEMVMARAQRQAHAMGYHFTEQELKMYFSTEVSTESTVGALIEDEDDDLPF